MIFVIFEGPRTKIMDLQEKVNIQREKIKQGNPALALIDSCRLNEGILPLSYDDAKLLSAEFNAMLKELDLTFFTPASGTGSRMFKALFEAEGKTEPQHELAKKILALPLAESLSDRAKVDLQDGNCGLALDEILNKNQLGYAQKPKGLIPFHQYGPKTRTPFQEHIIQSEQIGGVKSSIHFTINSIFEQEIIDDIAPYSEQRKVSFSEQDPSTNSIAFDKNFEPALNEEGEIISRPAGHGALILNLNSINSDLILIRNIDNMQHNDRSDVSTTYRRALSAKLIQFVNEVHNVLSKIARDHAFESSIKRLNETYQLKLTDQQLSNPNAAFTALNRPIRICGMVKNEGEPGGGPFWVKGEDGTVNRQIIEKSQISDEYQHLVSNATHFNPVELICSAKDFRGEKFDLTQFVDDKQFFVVYKTQGNQEIQYIEEPGLWNGAMANWLTLFYEIPATCFSPVKSVFDLSQQLHQPKD